MIKEQNTRYSGSVGGDGTPRAGSNGMFKQTTNIPKPSSGSIVLGARPSRPPVAQIDDQQLVDEYTEHLEEEPPHSPLDLAVETAEKMWQKHMNECAESGLTNPIKSLVSKNKKRFEWDGYDLDLAYITDHIIAMGFPSQSIESIYRNSMQEVQRFLDQKHPRHYKVYNLCAEKKYPSDKFGGRFAEYPFYDHMAPEFSLIFKFCKDVQTYLDSHKKNVAVIHCKAGKGRTGLMTSCYLMYSGFKDTAVHALQYYGVMRTNDHKGVTIPSQTRYAHYFQRALKEQLTLQKLLSNPRPIRISSVVIHTIPKISLFGGCTPWIHIQNGPNELKSKYSHDLVHYKESDDPSNTITITFQNSGVEVSGDFIVTFYNKGGLMLKKSQKFMHMCLHSYFLANGENTFSRGEIDGPKKDDSRFAEGFKVKINCFRLK